MRRTRYTIPLLTAIISLCGLHSNAVLSADPKAPHPYRLPSVDIKQPVIWGSTAEAPDGTALSFGGEDRNAEDGLSHTRLRANGEWIELGDQLRKSSGRAREYGEVWGARHLQKRILTGARHLYFEGKPNEMKLPGQESLPFQQKSLADTLKSDVAHLAERSSADSEFANAVGDARELKLAQGEAEAIGAVLEKGITPDLLSRMRNVQVLLEEIADVLGAEPPARALSPIIYEPKSKLFVLFGGDHCDYLTNDIWVFDVATRKWSLRHPKTAPPSRANHSWKTTTDGKLILTGGYTYFPNTDYMGGQYIDINDGDWTYDVAADTWTGSGKSEAANSRTYRTGPFLPEYFYDAPKPDAVGFQATLKSLPPNVWTKTNPPQLPKLNRDWGTAVIDPDRDLILRFSGGHCAHGGSDVLQYHLATNRWELCYPVEFPLGQLYTNTEYPGGYNFNHRPWISGHTYQNYGVDPISKKMIFLGHSPWGYVYDPDLGDWTTCHALPKKMHYSGDMYTLTTTTTPQGLICWTEAGDVFRFDAASVEWKQLPLTGERLPGAVVDNSTVIYDSHRDRLLFFRKEYDGKKIYDGEIDALDLKSLAVSHLSPAGKDAAGAIPYLCQIRYDPTDDLLLVGGTLPPSPDGLRRTPAYDCAANKWISLKITGDDPSGKQGRNVSLGMMYDARRKLFWAVDTNSQICVLRVDVVYADVKDLLP